MRARECKKFHLCIGQSDEEDEKKECQKCLAYDKIIDPNRDPYYQENYDDLEADLENITDYFLRLINEFNQIPTACFELEPSASH
ncbi:McrBC restriction endonuclease system McrB subunit [Helicobacter pylori]|uniref:McrBC restriction endonuclease system McrB subunit n=1 Tax=Helicobacter pylori TaxID=210 RepID=A0A377ISK2_HELPX|nr:McrBC restriction endonuclease system McrB subunit [Helicobacter pylori]